MAESSSDCARARMSLVASKALVAESAESLADASEALTASKRESEATPRFHGGDLKCCGAFKRLREAELQLFLRGASSGI